MKVVFFGNSEGAFSNRHYLALAQTPCEIVAVVETPVAKRGSTNTAVATSNFVELARQSGIPVFEPAKPNSPEFVATLAGLRPDLILAIGYANLLRSELLAVPRLLAANFHASLLPAYRGRSPLYWALANGEREVGLTVHVMDAGLDTGDILYQVRVPVLPGNTVATLYDRVMVESVPLVGRLIADLAAGRLERTPQGTEGASYYSTPEENR